ncbi:MAG: GIY-YIG nuclease family protein [Candidatus Pacearchaeota archaeon]|jgi:group I intron endonuclease|nr:GIY-YIG nuclease family protein [Clostridia bacterium]
MIIYKITNLINGKIYVGQDSHNNPNYFGSGILINKAIKKYGIENFKKEIIDTANTTDELNEKEIFWIKELHAKDSNIGYNLTDGGGGTQGLVFTDSHRQHMSEAAKEKVLKDSTKQKIGKATAERWNDPVYVIKVKASMQEAQTKITDEERSAAKEKWNLTFAKNEGLHTFRRGHKSTEEHRAKIGESNTGKKRSDEYKEYKRKWQMIIYNVITPTHDIIEILGVSEMIKFAKQNNMPYASIVSLLNKGKITSNTLNLLEKATNYAMINKRNNLIDYEFKITKNARSNH